LIGFLNACLFVSVLFVGLRERKFYRLKKDEGVMGCLMREFRIWRGNQSLVAVGLSVGERVAVQSVKGG